MPVNRNKSEPGAVDAARLEQSCFNAYVPLADVEGKVAFVTGGSSGIGLGIARAFVDAGMKVAISYRTTKHLDEAMGYFSGVSDRVRPILLDVLDRAAMEGAAQEMLDAFGKIHVLVSNAGVGSTASTVSQATYEEWDWVLGVNLYGVFNSIHAFLPRIKAQGEGGHILATASFGGLFVGAAGGACYTVSKFAVVGLMEALRAECYGTNIGVSVYCPGPVQSNIATSARNCPTQGISDPRISDLAREAAMDALDAGRMVLRGIRRNDLYILTHPGYETIMQDRHDAIIAASPRDAEPNAKQVEFARVLEQNSLYAVERDRQRRQSLHIGGQEGNLP